MSESTCLEHVPCEECGSKDNKGVFSDGHEYCFGCGYYKHADGREENRNNPDLKPGTYGPIIKRGLREETLRKFDYRLDSDHGCHYATYYDRNGRPVAQKKRTANKGFAWIGDPKHATLFGQHAWASGGKMIVVTEGEMDAMSMSQVQSNRWPVVSVKDGASSAVSSVRDNIEFLTSFEKVIFMFDADEPGVDAALACAALMPPGKGHIASLPLKDANEMLVAGRESELIDAMWRARPYRPDGIITGADLWDQLCEPDPIREASYPFALLDAKLHGLRRSELVMIAAGTGSGKSTICKEIAAHLIQQDKKVGMVALEETVKFTAKSLMSIYLSQPLHLTPMDPEDPRFLEAYEATAANVAFYDHWGSTESDNLLSKIRFMAVGLGCEYVILDHISIVVSGLDTGRDSERILLDRAMTRLASLAREVNIGLLVVCHLRKSGGTPFEEGGQVTLADLRGSGGIAQLSNIVIAAERNQQSDDSNRTHLRVLKNRFSGACGSAGHVRWNEKTGRLEDIDPFEEDESNTARPETGEQAPEF
jgi:twinkle protein